MNRNPFVIKKYDNFDFRQQNKKGRVNILTLNENNIKYTKRKLS